MYAQMQMQHKENLDAGREIVNPVGIALKRVRGMKIQNKPINRGVTYQKQWGIIEQIVDTWGGKVAGR